MSAFFRKMTGAVLYLRWPTLVIFILATAFFGYAISKLQIDPSTETLFAKDLPEYQFYREFRNHFGSDHLIAIAIETPNYLRTHDLRLTHVLTRVLSSDRRIDRVLSLTNALDVKHKIFGVKVEPLIKGVFEGEKPVRQFRKEVLANPLILGNLLSRDGKVGAILIRLKAKPEDPRFLQGYVNDLRTFLKSFAWPQARFYVAGAPIEQHDFIDAIRRDQIFFIPAVSLFLMLATYLIFRDRASVFVAMSIVFVTLLWTFGTIALLGRSLNLVNSLLAPVVMIISITSAIHVINVYNDLRPHHPSQQESICLTMQHLGIPCFLTAATTMAGFSSLVFNPVPAVQSFGFFAAVGTFYSYVVVMLLTPVLLPLLPFQNHPKAHGADHFFNQVVVFYLEKIEFHLKWFLLAGTAALVALSVVGITKIRVDTNLIQDLAGRSPLATATRFIDGHLAGVYSLGMSVKRLDQTSVATVETLKKVDELTQFLERQPEITKVNSLAMLVKKVHEAREGNPAAFVIPEDEETLQDYIQGMAKADNPDFWSFVSEDFRYLRLEARMKSVGTKRGRELEERIWDYVREHWGKEHELRITGAVTLLGKMSERLVANQMWSLSFAFFVILGLISLFFRSWKMGLLAAIPNLIPIVVLYGVVGFLGIELSTPVAMISSVALGLVVDASIHFLYRFRYEFQHRQHYLQALHHTYRNIGQSLAIVTLILVFGFASSIFSSFRPTLYFGLLTSFTILVALLCTLVLLPLVLTLLKPFGPSAVIKQSAKQTLTPIEPSSIISAST